MQRKTRTKRSPRISMIASLLFGVVAFQQRAIGAPPATNPAPATRPSRLHRPDLIKPTSWDDQATPAKAMYLLHIAMEFQGAVPLDAYAYGKDDFTRDYLRRSSEMVRASQRLQRAVLKRFGAQGLEILEVKDPDVVKPEQYRDAMEMMGDPMFGEIERTTFRIDGDRAFIKVDDEEGHFKKVGGKWMIEMTIDEKFRPFAEPAAVTDFELRMAGDITRRLEAGEFADAKAVQLEMAKRIAEGKAKLEKAGISFDSPGGFNPTTQPTSPPAQK